MKHEHPANGVMNLAHDIMLAKLEYNVLVIEQLEEDAEKNYYKIVKLEGINNRIRNSIALIEELEGCWS